MSNIPLIKSRFMSYIMMILAGMLACYVTAAACLYSFQRNILYIPNKNMGTPSAYHLPRMGALSLKTPDQLTITAWYAPPPDTTAPVIVYFHGNAGNLSDRREKLGKFLEYPIGLMALSYRGYGTSQGGPTEQGLYEDARTVINYLIEKGIGAERIVLYGESLGSGVAVQMATEYPVRALVLEAPYTSVTNRAQEKYPIFPIALLLKDPFDSITKIGNIHAPLLLFHGEKDTVIPIHHGRELFAKATVEKEAHYFPAIGHTDFDLGEITRLTMAFIGRH